MKLVKILFLLAFLIVPTSLMAQEADTIDGLVKMFDETKCKECHLSQHAEWKDSWHSKAIVSSLGGIRNFLAVGVPIEWKREITKVEVLKCLECHSPIVNYASDKLVKEIASMIIEANDTKDEKRKGELLNELSKLNVGCLACHNMKATAVAKGMLGEPEKGAIYTPKKVFADPHEGTGYKTVTINSMDKALFCAQCHGRYVARDGEQIVCNTLSGSYSDNYISNGGSNTCQDCHMFKNGRGHRMPGGHYTDMIKEGIGFNTEITGVRHTVGEWIPRAIIDVALENRAGHRIPDG